MRDTVLFYVTGRSNQVSLVPLINIGCQLPCHVLLTAIGTPLAYVPTDIVFPNLLYLAKGSPLGI